MNLRCYQIRAKDSIFEAWKKCTSTLLVAATGCVAGDAVIGMNRAGKGYASTLKKAFKSKNDPRRHPEIKTLVRSLVLDRIRLNPIQDIIYSGRKHTSQLTLENGRFLRLTQDHEVLTESGFIQLCDLSSKHKIIVESEPLSGRALKSKNFYLQVQGMMYHPFANHISTRARPFHRTGGILYRNPLHRLVIEAANNNLDLHTFIHICRYDKERADKLQFLDPASFSVHHKDRDHLNNAISNLEVMTCADHARLHGQSDTLDNLGYGFIEASRLASVSDYGEEDTYDVICSDPNRNFCANGIVVHNCGKTIIFSHVIKDMQPLRAMVLCHRDELLIQAKDKIEAVTGLAVDIEKAELYARENLFQRMAVVVSSIQTQISGPKDKRRYTRFKPEDFGLLVCDEGHHCTSKSWREVIDHYRKNPNLKVLGVTATPDRADEQALGQVFDSVAFRYDILDAIQDGYLVDITQQFVPVAGLDFSHIRTTAGDLNEGDLSKVMEAEENLQGICQPTIEVIHGLSPKTLTSIPVPEWRKYLSELERKPRRTIVFTVSVAQAERYCEIMGRAMDGVEWVCGATNKEKRRAILSRFQSGETHAVINCGVLLEGFDNPGVEVIVMSRPTKSRALYCQAIGRSTRPLPGLVDGLATAEERRSAIALSAKPYCRILDFVGNSGRHKLVTCVDVLGGKVSEAARERAKEKAQEEGKPVKILVTMTNAELELERQKQEAIERARKERAARKAHLLAKVDYRLQDVDPFGHSVRVAGTSRRSRDGREFSEKQAVILRKQGVDPCAVKYRQGQAIIAKVFSTPSDGQRKVLLRSGYANAEVNALDRRSASKLIDRIASNGWRKVPLEANGEPAMAEADPF